MRHAQINTDWSRQWQPPQRPLGNRAAAAVGRSAGRLAVAGGKHAGARWRPGMPLLAASAALVLTSLLRAFVLGLRAAHSAEHHAAVNIALLVAAAPVLLPAWWIALGWPVPRARPRRRMWRGQRLAHLAVCSLLLAVYLPVSVWWLPPWRTLGTPWLPAAVPTAVAALALWAWSYFGWYRIREIDEPEPAYDDGPQAIWEEHIGAQGGVFPGSRLTEVRDITAEVAS